MANRWLANLIGTFQSTFRFGAKTAQAILSAASLTASRTFTFPDATGTVAIGERDNLFSTWQSITYTEAVSSNVTWPVIYLRRENTSGTPGVGYGASILCTLHTTTTAFQNAGQLQWRWATATHASRASRCVISTWNVGTEQEVLTITSGATPTSAFLGDLSATGNVTGANITGTAAQADQELGTSTTLLVTPGRQHHHKSAAKAWVVFTVSGTTVTVRDSYGLAAVNPVVRNGVGDYSINFLTAFSSAYYAMICGSTLSTGSAVIYGFPNNLSAPTAGTGRVIYVDSTGTPRDAARVDLAFYGDQ